MTQPHNPLARTWLRVIGYAIFCLAGMAYFISPSLVIIQAAATLERAWALLLILGGLSASICHWMRKYDGEAGGLIMLLGAPVVYAISALATSSQAQSSRVPIALFMVAVAFLSAARIKEIYKARKQWDAIQAKGWRGIR